METLRVLLILGHLMGFATALYLVMSEDLRFLRAQRLDLDALAKTARSVAWALAALFVTGAAVIWHDTGFSPAEIAARPKLVAKIVVVTVLAMNGAALHWILFPMLKGPRGGNWSCAVLASLLGAVFSVSWLYASFLGVAKPLAGALGLSGFLGLYALALGLGMAGALLVVAPRLRRLMGAAPAAAGLSPAL